MTIELNDLAYGNLNYDYINLLDADNEFTRLKESFLDFPYPQIDETKLEIENLISVQENAIKSKSWDKQYSFMQTADKNLDKLFISFYLKNELVLDFAAGSCTTAVAAIQTGRKYICIEKEEKYCEIGIERTTQLQPTLF